MAAGQGFKTFTTGEVLTASDTNGYLMQGVLVFANAAARTAAITSPQEGQMSYLKDTDSVESYSGSAWVAVGGSVATSLGFSAGKNIIINGDFGVWQRGTSFSNPADTTYTADRFMVFGNGSGATKTVSQQTFTPGTAPVAGYEGTFFWRMAQTVAGTGATYNLMLQRIENVRNDANQTVTFSAWLKADAARTLTFSFNRNYGTGGSSMDYSVATSSNLSVTTSWTRFTFSFTMPTVAGKTIGPNSYIEACINYPLNTAQTIDVWGVQLEAGSTATAFQTASATIGGELALCQRYYWRQNAGSDAGDYTHFASGWATTTSQINFYPKLPVSMRVRPTSVEYSTLAASNGNVALSISLLTNGASGSTNWAGLSGTVSGATQYGPYYLAANGSASAYIGLSAEL